MPAHSLASTAEAYYLPMHSVTKESSTSTKLHVVFDASAKSSNGLSLNSTLLVGPTLHPKFDTILLRFRSYPIAVTGDMYREVELCEQDRCLHRLVWRNHPSEPILDYEMTRVTFGVAASPYLAVKALQHAALDFGQPFPMMFDLLAIFLPNAITDLNYLTLPNISRNLQSRVEAS